MHEIAVHDSRLEVAAGIRIRAQRQESPPEPPAPAQQIEAVVVGDRQEPGAGAFLVSVRRERVEGDEKDFVGGVSGIFCALEDGAAALEHGSEIGLIEGRQPATLLGGHRGRVRIAGSHRPGVIHSSLH